jgi:hypothetical protein
MIVRKWDLLTYKLGDAIEIGTVLQCFDNGDVRVDTDGVVEKERFLMVQRRKGKKAIYESEVYKSNEIYRLWLARYYGLPIKEETHDEERG